MYVFPTPVGVFPACCRLALTLQSLPHARGGVSLTQTTNKERKKSSPRPWGCFSKNSAWLISFLVFPTPVGVFPTQDVRAEKFSSLPHARGGVSPKERLVCVKLKSSPRPWGCFLICAGKRGAKSVFPTPVGVFLQSSPKLIIKHCLPHARGGVSKRRSYITCTFRSSPRPWGCFSLQNALVYADKVFPTPVGVFPISTTITTT